MQTTLAYKLDNILVGGRNLYIYTCHDNNSITTLDARYAPVRKIQNYVP